MNFIGKEIGNYRIIHEINSGTYGRVYKAEHLHLKERIVAIKFLHTNINSPKERDQFEQEAEFLAQLKHPHILPLIDFGFFEDQPYLITPYAAGGSLRDLLKQAPLPLDKTTRILTQVGQALHYAHEQQIIHRDLKPANILLNTQDGEALLADFGIATTLSTGTVMHLPSAGTPSYMAPEQFQDTVSKKSDQYSLGCIAYEMVTGHPPFTASSFFSMSYKHLTEEPTRPTQYNPHIPAATEAAILKALAKERTERYDNVKDFIEDFKQSVESADSPIFLKKDNIDDKRIIRPERPIPPPLTHPTSFGDLADAPTIIQSPLELSQIATSSAPFRDPRTDQTIPPSDLPPLANPTSFGDQGTSQAILPSSATSSLANPAPYEEQKSEPTSPPKPMWLRSRTWRLGIGGGVMIGLIFLIIFAVTNLLPSPQPGARTYCIGTDFPISGGDTTHGTPSREGADLAIAQNHNLGSGYTLDACDYDDTSIIGVHDPNTGSNNITQLIAKPNVIGMVGPQDGNVAQAEIPLAAQASLPIVSPSATDPCLTLEQYCNNPNVVHPYGIPNTFFRICGNSSQQAQADAQFLFNTLHISSGFFVVNDGEPDGEELVNAFSQSMRGEILGTAQISSGYSPTQISSLAQQIISSQARAVLYGGTTANGGGVLSQQLAQMGFTGVFVGSDGIAFDQQFLLYVGTTSDYTYATSMQPAPSNWSPKFVTSYQNYYHAQPAPNSAAGYDAAMILITAIKSVIKSNPSTDAQTIRRSVLEKIEHPDQPFTGLNGAIAFDSNGDNTMMRTLTVYAIENGQWVYKPANSINMG